MSLGSWMNEILIDWDLKKWLWRWLREKGAFAI